MDRLSGNSLVVACDVIINGQVITSKEDFDRVVQQLADLIHENERLRKVLEKIEKGEMGGRLANGEQAYTPYPNASLIAKQALSNKESE